MALGCYAGVPQLAVDTGQTMHPGLPWVFGCATLLRFSISDVPCAVTDVLGLLL